MSDKHFEAILAKNAIAREVRDNIQNAEPMRATHIRAMLKDIEAYIGEANQPSVDEIIDCTKFRL